ncbi:unnamed protein product [Acanthoscelides obtectus]|uniref:HAT C-terminal dimerisation domain-containing protein n=1 Tax=Acanthoscelides obtectus TaxID=200917 RepID=A0A9P0K8T8_ACAOB|nr:unnamed protein product [Acanthoscelides obtectus]CAK1633523.1 hypothetical protein AOBTE_LOCUS8193 [Acanthoscelides obtectus]
MKCICHSLALCASFACEKFPDDPEKLVRSIYSYMHRSYKRQSELRKFKSFFNIKPHKLLHASQTRWLSLISAVSRILEQYDATQHYFRVEAFDKVSASDEINSMLNNPLNKIYLLLLEYILPTFTNLNLEFQSEKPKICNIYPQMLSACKFLLSCFLKPDYLINKGLEYIQYHNPENFLSIDEIYWDPKAAAELTKHGLKETVRNNIKTKCLNFYIEAVDQLYKRFPFNSRETKILQLLTILSPPNIKTTESIALLAFLFPNLVNDINTLDREFRHLKFSNFDFSLDETEFWKEVRNAKRGDNSLIFPELANFVNVLFALPHSSASVERLFFEINLNKTKMRNKLGSKTMNGILHSERLISLNNDSCFNFSVTEDIINRHNNSMYK